LRILDATATAAAVPTSTIHRVKTAYLFFKLLKLG